MIYMNFFLMTKAVEIQMVDIGSNYNYIRKLYRLKIKMQITTGQGRSNMTFTDVTTAFGINYRQISS